MFLDAGYSPDLFWQLGIDQVIDLIECYGRKMSLEQEKRKGELKDYIMLLWNQNLQLLDMVGHSNSQDEDGPRMPYEYYPELFGEEIKLRAEEEKKERQLEEHKAQMLDYITIVNQRFKERGESSGGNDT